jgi:hypothetical protein
VRERGKAAEIVYAESVLQRRPAAVFFFKGMVSSFSHFLVGFGSAVDWRQVRRGQVMDRFYEAWPRRSTRGKTALRTNAEGCSRVVDAPRTGISLVEVLLSRARLRFSQQDVF